MATKKARLDGMCPSAGNASIGTMLDLLRDAVNIIATNLDADGIGASDYVANVTTALGLADAGTYDLDTE